MAKAEVTSLAPVDPAPARPLKPLPRSAIKLLESTNASWRCVVPAGTTRQQLVLPDLWRTVGQDFHPLDELRVVDEASTFFAQLLVVEAHPGFTSVIELGYWTLPRMIATADSDVPSNFEILHAGPEKMWIVKRNDGVVYGEGFTSRTLALQHLLDHAAMR